jgi:hypothetical protein
VELLALENNIDFLDLTKSFKQHSQRGKRLYYLFDSHWNSMGRKVAAEDVTKFLIRRGKFK